MTASALAGAVATAPMTAAMEAMHRQLPPQEQYPLPPREIIDQMTPEAVEPVDHKSLAIAGHFAYGAAAGSLFALAEDHLPGHPAIKGALYGLGVWTGSYLGWLPAVGILKPATEHPGNRNALMIAAHLVWGSALGLMLGHKRR
jgi:uncharacterized membrane protein YagU involved in acid resistance